MQNRYGRPRDELLDETPVISLTQAGVATARWRADYKTARPHFQIAVQTPSEFANTFPRWWLALRYADSSAPECVASPASKQNHRRKRTQNWIELGCKVTPPVW